MTPASIITKRYVLCPACGKSEHQIEHLVYQAKRYAAAGHTGYGFGPWTCDRDECGVEFHGRVMPDGSCTVKINGKRKTCGLALLKFRGLYLVLEEKYGRIAPDHADFFYHSHQCPTNLMRKVFQVHDEEGRRDPHGRIRFLANIDDTPEAREALDAIDDTERLFKLFHTDGEEPETDWPEENGGLIPVIAQWRREAKEQS